MLKLNPDYQISSKDFPAAAPQLLAQAVRVHLANRRQGTQSTLTRSEVSGTRKKMYKQKGTGRARHGDQKAPIFVHGGIAFGPKPRDFSRKLPRSMRRAAILGAISLLLRGKKLAIFSAKNFDGKTKKLAKFLKDVGGKSWLLVVSRDQKEVIRAGRNVPNLTVMTAVNTYQLLRVEKVLIEDKAMETLLANK